MPDQPTNTGAGVPERADRAGEAPQWVERTIWTDRMLSALATGVQGGTSNAFFAERGLISLVGLRTMWLSS